MKNLSAALLQGVLDAQGTAPQASKTSGDIAAAGFEARCSQGMPYAATMAI